ncbi:MAG: DUF4058 family protein [Cyanobacteria bacterium P01_F01_bin.53]
MPIPFPGMNPYLEHPDLWPKVHQKLMAALAETLKQQLPDYYQVRSQSRHYQVSGEDSLVVGSPGLSWSRDRKPTPIPPLPIKLYRDLSQPSGRRTSQDQLEGTQAKAQRDTQRDTQRDLLDCTQADPQQGTLQPAETENGPTEHPTAEHRTTAKHIPVPEVQPNGPISVLVPVPQKIYETYLEVIDTNGDIVTVIEALSPKKKRPGRGRTLYERQRETIFGSPSHFVEIDLLRGWEPPSIYGPDESGDYRMLISRSEQRPRAQLYTWNVMEAIPPLALPLSGHDELLIDLKAVVDQACDRTDLLVNYQQNPLPPLRHHESIWLEEFLQQVGMRPCVS